MYVYCKKCGWSQDDFWTWNWTWKFWKWHAFGYNPLQRTIDTIRFWIKPRFVKIETDDGIKKVFSWKIMFGDLKRIFRSAINMKWYTYQQFKNDKNRRCPKCGCDCIVVD